jgi:hypothetical protein
MKRQTDGELRKHARSVELRRNFGVVAPAAPITMNPPPGEALYKQFTLASGNTFRPNFSRGGEVTVHIEGDFLELLREGWRSTTKTGD